MVWRRTPARGAERRVLGKRVHVPGGARARDIYLGWATLPFDYKFFPSYDGVVVFFPTLPGTNLEFPVDEEPERFDLVQPGQSKGMRKQWHAFRDKKARN